MIAFRKMHGAGNDFVVVDARREPFAATPALTRAIADRHTGIGFDQLVVIGRDPEADAALRFFNPDGGEAGACGNGTRCAASLILAEGNRDRITLKTAFGLLVAEQAAGRITVDMGAPRLGWQDMPLARAMATEEVPLDEPALGPATCCSMGNPHATFFVADADAVPLDRLGPKLEHHALFPERCNIGIASLLGPGRLRLRVWERGAGETLACGSGACAALVAAVRRGLTGAGAALVMQRDSLFATWREDGHVLLSGPVATSYTGEFQE